jgi:D-amino peptidase
MKIYILADMEGISGIRRPEQVQRDQAEYGPGCELMMQDINAAIAGAFAGGATEVIAADTHGGGGQVRLDRMDGRASYEMPAVGKLMPSLDASFGGLILLGHHARAGTLNGFLDHTMNSSAWFEYRINDRVVGEIGIEAAWAGHHGVPVVMVSGDQATADEARDLLGDVECAVVKWGLGRNRARCLSLEKAHALVRETAARAVTRAGRGEFHPYQPQTPGVSQLTLYRSDYADEMAARAGVERVDARTVRKPFQSLLNVCI